MPVGARRGDRARLLDRSLLAGLLLAPVLIRDAFLIDRLGVFLLLGLCAVSLDLLWGYGGILTFGHAVLVGGAGYVVALATTGRIASTALPLAAGLALAVAAAALLSAATAWFGLHGRRPLGRVEFALLTLALTVLGEQYARSSGLLGGRNGIVLSTRLTFGPLDLHRGTAFYVLAASILVGGVAACRMFLRTRHGMVLHAARDDAERVELLGLDVRRARLAASCLAGGLAGLAGGLIHTHDAVVSPGAVGITASTSVLLWVVLGGRGSLTGPALAAVVLQSATTALSGRLLETWLLAVGVLLMVTVLLLPKGLHGALMALDLPRSVRTMRSTDARSGRASK
jgi:branched-chain amino acid transport system permease protein